MFHFPDCLCCTATISRKPSHIVTELLSQTIDLLWGILYPFPGELAVGLISVAPAHDHSINSGCSWGKLIFTIMFLLTEIGKDKCCP